MRPGRLSTTVLAVLFASAACGQVETADDTGDPRAVDGLADDLVEARSQSDRQAAEIPDIGADEVDLGAADLSDACVADCNGKECGNDGCGGTCGLCTGDKLVCVSGECVCLPSCKGKQCGYDGCTGSCGSCAASQECVEGQCLECQPKCWNKECGDDGCGGSCGQCSTESTCVEGSCCAPDCESDPCGPDGCGGECDFCEVCGEGCVQGVCTFTACDGKECGDDGCGGSCGSCAPDEVCLVQFCAPTSGSIWVDAGNADDPLEDGSEEHPFDTLAEAFEVVVNDSTVLVLPGLYQGGNVISAPGVSVIGAGALHVTVESPTLVGAGLPEPEEESAFIVTADSASVKGMSLLGGAAGVSFLGSPGTPLQGGSASYLRVSMPDSGQTFEGECGVFKVGILARHVDDLVVEKVEIDVINSETSHYDGCPATGIRLEDCKSCTVASNVVSNLAGGAAPGLYTWSCASPSGSAYGIDLHDCFGGTVSDNVINDVSSGFSGQGDSGEAHGIRLTSTTGCDVIGNSVAAVQTANTDDGVAGLASGISLVGPQDCAVDQNSVFDIHGAKSDYHWQCGGHLSRGARGIVLSEAPYNCTVTNNVVSQVTSASGGGWSEVGTVHGIHLETPTSCLLSGNLVSGLTGPDAKCEAKSTTGISLTDATDCQVLDSTVESLAAGNGGSTEPVHCITQSSTKRGGEAAGIRVEGINCAVSGNTVHGVKGGPPAGCYTGPRGGPGIGLDFLGSGIEASRNKILLVSGGDGPDVNGYSAHDGGPGIGVRAVWTGCDNCILTGNLVSVVAGGDGGDTCNAQPGSGGSGTGVELTCEGCQVAGNTLHEVKGGAAGQQQGDPGQDCQGGSGTAGSARGLYLPEGQSTPVVVSSAIITNIDGACLDNHLSNPADMLVAEHSDLFGCAGGLEQNAVVQPTCIEANPMFVDAAGGDLHLLPTSPCIDTGDPAQLCTNEPAPNGCRVNMGAYGNTPEATSALGAPHCDVCP